MSTIISQKQDLLGLSRDNPVSSRVLSRKLISKNGSSKATYHLTVDLKTFKKPFMEGDAFAIFPENDSQYVNKILALLNLKGDQLIIHPKTQKNLSLVTYLKTCVNLNKIHPKLLSNIQSQATENQSLLKKLLDPVNKEQKKTFLQEHDLLSSLKTFLPTNLCTQSFCESMLPMLPRFYSCASSYDHNPQTVDFVISTFHYEIQNETKAGVGSDFLCHQADIKKTPISIYLQKNATFQLPKDPSIPIIMIGPGTGVAPFRAFMQKRALQKSSKNWLFFGERHRSFDYYYEDEWLLYQKNGLLDVSLAFSRDQKQKIYVQHRLFEERKKLLSWLDEGAIIYVCGDAKHMEKDVKNTLLEIFTKELSLDADQAKYYLADLRNQKRYLTDVY